MKGRLQLERSPRRCRVDRNTPFIRWSKSSALREDDFSVLLANWALRLTGPALLNSRRAVIILPRVMTERQKMPAAPDIDCGFDDAPLMLALAQITFTQSPEVFKNITEVKAAIAKLGMPIAQSKQQVSFALKVGSAAPQVTQSQIWWFVSLDKRRAVAVAQNSVVLYEASYSRFTEFRDLMCKIVDTVSGFAGDGCFLTSVALRYLSGFSSDGHPSPYLVSGLHGLPTESLQTEHYHHTYGFWCSTSGGGRLVVNVKTVHGDQLIPQDIQTAGVAIDGRFALPKETDAVQLDIHETIQRKTMQKLDAAEIERLLDEMRKNVKICFLLATTEDAHTKWKITNN